MMPSGLPEGQNSLGHGVRNLRSSVDLGCSPSQSQQMKKQKNNCEAQAAWRPPLMVEPEDIREDEEPQGLVDHGELDTDAKLYVVKENTSNGEEKIHSLLQMPSCLPNRLLDKSQNAYLSSSSYNILMIDVSGSMSGYWRPLMLGWNQYVAPCLIGRTSLFVFGDSVALKRSGTILKVTDFGGGGTDLTGALQTIVNEVYQCKERYIKVFLITDGHHNVTPISPETVIQQMCSPKSKKCDVFVLGAGSAFPVQYSINIRSRLHNGSANIPSLFWARRYAEMEERMEEIGSKISDGTSQTLRLSVAGFSLPEGEAKYTFHPKEWVYFPLGPEHVQRLALEYHNNICHILLEPCQIQLSVLNEVFRQWNSVIIQMHNKKEVIPSDIIPFMERLFNTLIEDLSHSKSGSIRERLARKDFNTCILEFRTLLNKIRAILTTAKFSNELELAENILSTTVGGGKYETKILQMKGHTDEEYAKDCEEFMKIYEEQKTRIQDIKVTPEDCCRITLSCTVSDLQDPDFPMMINLNKFEFMKQFTITGIPVYAPSRDSVAINPWSFGIHALVNAPYTIMSQVAIELYADSNPVYKINRDVQLKWDSLKTHFNAIVPVFSPDVARVMSPLVHTRLYSMCTTFAILKNPHIIDFNIHMAALGVTWVRILFEYPTQPRPEFVHLRIKSIEATAALYLNRPSYTKYWQMLISDTAQALMTESTITVENKTIKCESLIKPMFILHLHQRSENPQDASVVANIMRMILLEYIGRCLSHYKTNENNSTPFTDFFAKTLADQELKKEWVQKYIATTKESMAGSEGLLLEDYYTLEKVQKAARKIASEEVKNLKEKLTAQIPIAVDLKKVERLRNVSLAGDVSWFTLQIFAREVGLMEEVIDNLFSEQSLFVYTAHALQYRASRERLTTPVADYEAIRTLVTKHVQQENSRIIAKALSNEIVQQMQGAWLQAYLDAHIEVVQPMTRQQILVEALGRGVDVTDATFEQVYKKYRPDVGLLGNACQCRACPYFLIPNKSYNQHSSVERRGPAAFPHGLHRAAYRLRDSDLSTVISHLESGTFNTPVPLQSVQPYRDKLAELKDIYKEIYLHQQNPSLIASPTKSLLLLHSEKQASNRRCRALCQLGLSTPGLIEMHLHHQLGQVQWVGYEEKAL
nr:uncharacterized protein LOC123771119 isoform X2 [Procambarus clarkii]XP_045619437.1 uncharacterized protein LOC123771119 isoform X2 [Procambarus clarkii]XP_045619438.1 uncharacterized protein LOC123771119 isoform X2 [Procambarus clarkii]XP_045619439.1 uncharacterized protein LOC123771119 isoform X2 [Procambarus clarkii]XP_045619440.1 uncharacterized protein LOC123771119 isoform X2 [Procambarus clarkii]XP_045619441.1 uncharacterized protein LOC123771119 isoform X2 [Procambarus clarkii]XP_04